MDQSSEKQKMLTGELYLASDPELTEMRSAARQLLRSYNASAQDEPGLRRTILAQLLGAVGDGILIEPPFYCDYGSNIRLGDNVYLNFNCVILDCCPVILGNNVKLGPAVQIYAAYHPVLAGERIKGPELAAPITIGDNVWIGGGTIICPGVSIRENTTIGAGSVVVKNIPANVVAVGNPCRQIRALPNPCGVEQP